MEEENNNSIKNNSLEENSNSENSSLENSSLEIPELEKNVKKVDVFIPEENQSENNSNVNSIFGNSNDEDEIAITQKEFVPEHERLYDDDEVYFQDLENYFLSELSLTDQNSIFKQKRIIQQIEDILSLKNKAVQDVKSPLDKNPFIFKLSNNNFSSSYIIPIVLDKKREYVKMDEDEIEAQGVKEFIELTDVDANYDKLLEIKRQFRYGEINLPTYYRLTIDLSLPFLMKETLDEREIGYKTTLSKASSVLRFDNIHNKGWKIRRTEGRQVTNHLYYEENKAVPTVVDDVIFEGEEVNIVGFLLLPFGKDNVCKNLEGKQMIAKSGILGNITEITKSDNAIITLENHKLSNGDTVFIQGSNSFPSVDGLHEDIILIDENRFMVRVNTLNGKVGDKGNVYSSLPINMKEVDVNKLSNLNKEYPLDKARFYFLDQEIVNKDDYEKMLEKTLPSVFEIFKKLPLDKVNSVDEIKLLLEDYNINFNDLYIDYYQPIQKVIDDRISVFQKEKIDTVEFYLKNYQAYLDKKGIDLEKRKELIERSIYRDDFLKHPTIAKYYGVYSPLTEAEDNVLARFLWVKRKVDFGNLFYTFVKVSLTKTNSLNKNQLEEIETQLELLDKKNSNLIKKIENENKKNKSTGLCNQKKGLVVFKTMGELEASQKIDAYKDGEYAIVEINDIPSKQPIFVWSSLFNKWENNKFISNYADLCNFGSLKINDFDFRKVLCMDYENQCKLVQQIRLERAQKDIENIKKEYQEAGKYYEKRTNLSLLERELEAAILKIQIIQNKYAAIFEKEDEEGEKTHTIEKTPLQELLGYINNLSNEDDIIELKFKLIVKDGLLIDKTIYSKTFKTPLLCGHYQYLYDISRNINTPKEQTILNNLISVYGDSGKANPGFITCQYCGEILVRDEYDNNEGISKVTGEIRKTRDVLQSDKEKYVKKQVKLATEQKELDFFRFDCNSNEYRNELIQKGLNLVQVPSAIELCGILNSLLQKMNILLKKNDFLQIIINVIQKLGAIPDYKRWRKDKLDKLQIKNPGIDFSRINESVLEDEYKVQIKKKKVIFVSAHLLLTLQTATPPYDIRASVVSFSGIDGDQGLTFMAQLLEKTGMAVIQTPLQKQKKIQKVLDEDELKEEILKALQIFKLMPEIRKRFDLKHKYLEESAKGKKISTELGIKSAKYPEVNELPLDMDKILNKDSDEKGSLYSQSQYILDRLNYLGQESIEDIYRYVEGNEKLYPSEIASSCCIQLIDANTNYDTPIIEKTDGRFEKNLVEINRGYEYLFDIRNKIIPPWFRNKPRYTFFCGDLVALTFFRNENLEHKRFANYQMNGEKEKFDQEKRSLFTGKTKAQMLNEDHTEEEYRELIHNIMKRSYKKLVEFKEYPKLKLEELLQRSDDYLKPEIINLVKKMDSYLHQKSDPDYINRRVEFLTNLGILNKKEKEEMEFLEKSDISAVQKYISRNQFAFERAKRIINIINLKFRKNIVKLSNEFRRIEKPLDDVSDEVEKNLNIFIENQDDFLNTFINKTNAALLKILKWDYTPQEIQSVLGKPPKMNEEMTLVEDKNNVTMEDAVSILIYILVNQLDSIIDTDFENANLSNLDSTQIPKQINLYSRTMVVQVMETIFREIENDNKIFDFTKSQFIQYKRVIYNNHYEKEAVKFNEMTEGQKMLYKLGFDYKDISAKEMEQISQLDNSILYEEQEKEDFYIMKAKEMYVNEYGEEPTDSQLEDMKDKLKAKDKYDKQEDDDFGKTGVTGGDYGDLDVNVFGEEDMPIIDENAYIEEEAEI